MSSILLITFRESIEISLLLGMIGAAMSNFKYKQMAILIGIILGCVGAVIMGWGIIKFSYNFDNKAQELFQIFVYVLSVILIATTIRWMKQNIRDTKQIITSRSAVEDKKSYLKQVAVLSLIISATIWREGAEIFIFVYTIILSKQVSIHYGLIESAVGILTGVVIGWGLYRGLILVSFKKLFNITNWFMILLASNISVKILNLLDSIEVIALDNSPVWNSSGLLREDSPLGKLLNSIVGYNSKPSLAELLAYSLTFIILSYVKNQSLDNKSVEKIN